VRAHAGEMRCWWPSTMRRLPTATSASCSYSLSASLVCGPCPAVRRPRRLSCAAGTLPWTARDTAPAAAPARCP
jgi:hypothetical protein